jgi:hypothetical protein
MEAQLIMRALRRFVDEEKKNEVALSRRKSGSLSKATNILLTFVMIRNYASDLVGQLRGMYWPWYWGMRSMSRYRYVVYSAGPTCHDGRQRLICWHLQMEGSVALACDFGGLEKDAIPPIHLRELLSGLLMEYFRNHGGWRLTP